MRVLGLPIPFTADWGRQKSLSTVNEGRGWYRIFESFAGAWQTNTVVDYDTAQSNHAVFSCQTLIASDVSKMRVKLTAQDSNGVWQETTNRAYSPVLRRPNHFQNRIQFFESWVLSKLQRGNTIVLKQRDNRNVVTGLYVLDWTRVRPMIADNGDVFYELQDDKLAGIGETVYVPAREVIHDRFNCLFHPLIGVSPIYAAGLPAMHGQTIQQQATKFFQNGARPGGLLLAPGRLDQEKADELKAKWKEAFTGANAGMVAVLADGFKYEALASNSDESQLIEQLKWTAEQICGVYHVPAFLAGVGAEPNYNNVQNLTLRYYSQCLQSLIEAIELCLDEGLGMGETIGTEFDLEALLRMDTKAQMEVVTGKKGIATLNEQRRDLGYGPQDGGDTIYLQQQDHSLAAIAARDQQLIEGPQEAPLPANDNQMELQAARALQALTRGLT